VAKIESAIREAIQRGARRQARALTTPLRREVRRLRLTVGQLRRDLSAWRDVARQWQRLSRSAAWKPEVSEVELKASRLSPRLIQKLRARLALSQAALARLTGVSTGAVVQWEHGRSTPSGPNRKSLVALRKLGRRDAKRLLASLPRTSPARPARRRRRRRRPAGRRRK
jgi:DNA-binding transcriptional regulator YiaG